MTLKDRVKQFIDHLGIETKAFETKCELSNGFVNNIGHSIREKSLLQIESAYPELNRNWLITGIGEMLIDRREAKNNINAKHIGEFDYPMSPDDRVFELGNNKYGFLVPKVPEYGYAGYIAGWKDTEYLEDLPKHMAIVDHPPKGEYLAVEVAGVSMENWTSEDMAKQSLRDGEVVTGRNIPKIHWKNRFHLHKFQDFIIVHRDGILIKRIIAHDVEAGIITCHSLNPNKDIYPDFQIDLREVEQLLNIVQPKR